MLLSHLFLLCGGFTVLLTDRCNYATRSIHNRGDCVTQIEIQISSDWPSFCWLWATTAFSVSLLTGANGARLFVSFISVPFSSTWVVPRPRAPLTVLLRRSSTILEASALAFMADLTNAAVARVCLLFRPTGAGGREGCREAALVWHLRHTMFMFKQRTWW